MDDDFSNESYVTFYVCDVTRTDETELRAVGRVRLPDRACRIDWSLHTGAQGIVAVACNNGVVAIYSVAAVLAAKGNDAGEHALLWSLQGHQGAVHGCQFNIVQPNFLATGGDDGKWYVWSIPAKTQEQPQKVATIANSAQASAITDIQWHPKYHHIVATATAGGVVCTWNLKTVSLAMKVVVGKGATAGAATCLAWHPTAATTLAVGVDDANPVVQIWDLKRVLSPELELKGHQRAVTGLSWNAKDASLLASCGADGHTMWWDPTTGKKLGELETEAHGVIDVQWCPVLSAVLATSSFEPLFCVSTAEDMSGAQGGDVAGTVPRWMQERPCGASINAALTVASLVPGTTDQLQLTSIVPRRPPSESASPAASLHRLRAEVQQFPRGSEERGGWLAQHGYPLMAAFSAARTDRNPILAYITEQLQRPQAASAQDDDPFAELAEEAQKSVEDRATELVASGRIEEAVNLCLEHKRFDDAFAIAFLKGELMPNVHQQFVAYVFEHQPERRHVLFAGAIASGDYTQLVHAKVPWQEVLSSIVSFVGDGFAEACAKLGLCLKEAKEYEGAETCFLCSRDVDEVVELWRLQKVPIKQVVADAFILEETAERQVTHPFFGECLNWLGTQLLQEGYAPEAMEYLQRAAQLGVASAAAMVDQFKYLLPVSTGSAAPPYPMDPVSDCPSPACAEFLAMLQQQAQQRQYEEQQRQQRLQEQQRQEQQRQQQLHQQQQQQQQFQQQQQQQQRPNFPGQPQGPYQQPPVQAQPPYMPPTPQQAPYQQSAQGPAPPRPYVNSSPFPQQPLPPQQPPQPQQQQQPNALPLASAPPPQQPQGLSGPPAAAAFGKRPPLFSGASQQQQQPPPSGQFPGQQQQQHVPPPPPPQAAAAPPKPSAPPQPRLMPHPVSAYSSARTPPSANTGGAPLPTPGTGSVPPPPSVGSSRMGSVPAQSQPQPYQQQPQQTPMGPPRPGGMPPQQQPPQQYPPQPQQFVPPQQPPPQQFAPPQQQQMPPPPQRSGPPPPSMFNAPPPGRSMLPSAGGYRQ